MPNEKSSGTKEKGAAARPEWREEVGRSGVYPMSAPFVKGDAPLRNQMGWGQGERGALGYEDHGSSALLFQGGALLGGLDAEWAEIFESFPPATAAHLEIPVDCWAVFCDWFTARHIEILTTVCSHERDRETAVVVRSTPLVRVSARVLEDGVGALTVQLHRMPSDYILNITRPRSLIYGRNPDQSPEWLRISHDDGSVVLSFERTDEARRNSPDSSRVFRDP